MLFRLPIMLLISHLLRHRYPPEFDLSASADSSCRIFARPAFSQDDCGACVAFAVAAADAMRGCVRDGRDRIPSPYRLFDCGGGSCANGSVVEQLVETLNRGDVSDVDEDAERGLFGRKCKMEEPGGGYSFMGMSIPLHHARHLTWPHRLTSFHIPHDDSWLIKTELYVYRNPVLVVIEPDAEMSLYRPARSGYLAPFELPVYHVTGPALHPHVVVAFGWGTVPEPYWLIQNSWGDGWGDRGRGRIAVDAVEAAVVLDVAAWRADWSMVGAAWLSLVLGVVCEGLDRWCCCCGGGGRVRLGVKRDEDLV